MPLIGYYDIFKNFYANNQEENFYIIGATTANNKKNGVVIVTIQGKVTNSTMKVVDKYINTNSLVNVMISQKQNPTIS